MGCLGLVVAATILGVFTVWLKAVVFNMQKQIASAHMQLTELRQAQTNASHPPQWRATVKGRSKPITLYATSEVDALMMLMKDQIEPRHIITLERVTPIYVPWREPA